MRAVIFAFAFFLLMASAVHAATIQGTIYDWTTLEPVPDTVVTVNSNPQQTYISKEGTYSFELAPGAYILSAVHYTNSKPDAAINETITITSEGIFTIDLILFPETDFGSDLFNESDFDISDPYEDEGYFEYIYLVAVAGVVLVVFAFRKRIRGHLKAGGAEKRISQHSSSSRELSGELKQVVSVLKKNGGRMTQKDIRREFPLSEAKVSLMITELESLGIVKRIKKGRTNVVVFQKKSDS